MPESLISSPMLNSLALTLLHFVWQGLLVALVLKSTLMATSTQQAQLRYTYASLAMLANLLLPFATFFIIYTPQYLHLSAHLQTMPLVNAGLNLQQYNSIRWYGDLVELFPYISLLWLAIVCMLSTKLLIELYAVNQLPKSHFIAADEKLQARFYRLVAKIQLKNTPQLIISLKTDVPMAIGWLKPIVLIPASMLTGLTPSQLDMLILHELAHIRRYDYLVNFIQTLVELLLFFHPAVKWVSNQMRNEREYCSDDIAVQNCGNAIAYAHTLADTATLCNQHRHHSIPTMAMAASGGDLKQRVIRLVEHHHCSTSNQVSKWLASAVIILSVIVLTSKQVLTLPQFDLSSGSVSLLTSPSNTFYQDFDAISAGFSKSSLALQLLVQDNVNGVENSSKTNEAQYKNALIAKQESKEISKTKDVGIATDSSLVDLTRKSTNTSLTSPINMPSMSEKIATNSSEQEPHSNISNKHQSIAEFAFSRTDSAKTKSNLVNPYADQLTSLMAEPELKNSHPIVENNLALFQTDANSVALQPTTPATAALFEAELISSIEPKYPATAKRKGIELEVMVDFVIDKNGMVKNIQFESKGKVGYFRNAVRAAVEQWRFLPARVNGKAIDSKMSKIFSFTLV